MKVCKTCGAEIPAARLKAMPSAVQCVPCLQQNGDEAPVRGHMVWDHKTAPAIEIGTKLANDRPDAHPRQGKNSAGLSAGRVERLDEGSQVVNRRMARCHPDRPAIGPSGKCVECAQGWYEERLWR